MVISPFLSCVLSDSQLIMEALLDIYILSWNTRGTPRHLKDKVRRYNPTFLVILETHVPFAKLINFCTNNGYTPVNIVEAQGHSGGIWLLQNSATTLIATVIDFNTFSITFNIKSGNVITTCTCIYAIPNLAMRPNLSNHLTTIIQNITSPWMLIGDFNDTLLPSEQRGVFLIKPEPQFSLLSWKIVICSTLPL